MILLYSEWRLQQELNNIARQGIYRIKLFCLPLRLPLNIENQVEVPTI